MNRIVSTIAGLAVALMLGPLSSSESHAKKPGGGGGGPGPSAAYSLVDLGGFTGGDLVQAWAQDVNNPGADGILSVVGFSFAPNRDEHAALWSVTAGGQILGLTDIAPAGYVNSRARQVNDLGFVLVGGYVWVPGTGLLSLPGFGGGNGSPGIMDDLGNVFGSAPDANGVEHPAVWHIDLSGQISGPVDLGDAGGFNARDINNNGLMAGSVVPNAAIAQFDAAGTLHVQILGALGPGHVAHAVAVNEFGMVAGNSRDPSGTQVAFVWTAATGMVGLGSLDGRVSVATDINDQGQIVGWSTSAGRFPQVAFVWQNGQMFDLNLLTEGGGGKNWIQIASGINDQGHIVGLLTKTKPISEQHGLLLVPNSP